MQTHKDLDPAASLEQLTPEARAKAIHLTNYGTLEGVHAEAAVIPPAIAPLTPVSLGIEWTKVAAFLQACKVAHVHYGLGAKVPNDASVPGVDFTAVDCSGFVRAAIRRATTPSAPFPDGSVVQHDWVKARGYAAVPVADGSLTDDTIRIAFLSPADSGEGIGHVVLIRNGSTAESQGGVGPDSRPFDGTGWQAKAKVYLLQA